MNPLRVLPLILLLLMINPSSFMFVHEWERVVVLVSDTPLAARPSAEQGEPGVEAMLSGGVEAGLSRLRMLGIPFTVVDILTKALHGAVIEVPSSHLPRLASVEGGLRIYQDVVLYPRLSRSAPWIGASEAHRLLDQLGRNFTGEGVKVAVVDTGIDYNHPDLGGGFGPGEKVQGGFDFVDDDPDPLDPFGHGTMVAGIIAADGEMKGIAPKARLYAYRVVDGRGRVSASDLVRALERALEDDVDIVNVSLGVESAAEFVREAVRNAWGSGVVVVLASGNSGPKSGTLEWPAVVPEAISVGASFNNRSSAVSAELKIDPIGFTPEAVPMDGSNPTAETVIGRLVYVGYAREEELDGVELRGAIALAERGPMETPLFFSEKERNVASHGAVSLVVFNYDSDIFRGRLTGPHNPLSYRPSIPVASISGRDGEILKGLLSKGAVNASLRVYINPDAVAPFSSRGPASSFYIKPDLVAPGSHINTTSTAGKGYELGEGTSFAAPHAAGAAALLLQREPSLTPDQVKSILASTSTPLRHMDAFVSVHGQGSGRLDVLSALLSPVAVAPHQLVFHLAELQNASRVLVNVSSISDSPTTAIVNLTWPFQERVGVWASPSRLALKGKDSAGFIVNAALREGEAGVLEGRLNLDILEPSLRLTVPLLVYVNNASLWAAPEEGGITVTLSSPRNFSEASLTVTSPSGVTKTYRISGGEPAAFVEAFEAGEYWVEAEARSPSGVFIGQLVTHAPGAELAVPTAPPLRALTVMLSVTALLALALYGAKLQQRGSKQPPPRSIL